MKPKLIGGIIMLVKVTKRFINFDYDLSNGIIYGKHNFDDQSKPKYDKGLRFIFLRWSNLILGKKLDSFVHIRNTIMYLNMFGFLSMLFIKCYEYSRRFLTLNDL